MASNVSKRKEVFPAGSVMWIDAASGAATRHGFDGATAPELSGANSLRAIVMLMRTN